LGRAKLADAFRFSLEAFVSALIDADV